LFLRRGSVMLAADEETDQEGMDLVVLVGDGVGDKVIRAEKRSNKNRFLNFQIRA